MALQITIRKLPKFVIIRQVGLTLSFIYISYCYLLNLHYHNIKLWNLITLTEMQYQNNY